MSEPVEFLSAERLYLRPVEESDLARCQRWINDPQIRRFLLSQRPLDGKAELEWWQGLDRDVLPKSIVLAICLREGDVHIGNTGLHGIDWLNRAADTGTLIGEASHQNKGYGSEAKRLILDYAFETLNLHSVHSHTIEFNQRSAAFLRKSGYREEGRLRQRFFREGRYHDAILFAVTRDEWRAAREQAV